jgi:hypothetical protein
MCSLSRFMFSRQVLLLLQLRIIDESSSLSAANSSLMSASLVSSSLSLHLAVEIVEFRYSLVFHKKIWLSNFLNESRRLFGLFWFWKFGIAVVRLFYMFSFSSPQNTSPNRSDGIELPPAVVSGSAWTCDVVGQHSIFWPLAAWDHICAFSSSSGFPVIFQVVDNR